MSSFISRLWTSEVPLKNLAIVPACPYIQHNTRASGLICFNTPYMPGCQPWQWCCNLPMDPQLNEPYRKWTLELYSVCMDSVWQSLVMDVLASGITVVLWIIHSHWNSAGQSESPSREYILPIDCLQYNGCLNEARSQRISSRNIDLVPPERSGLYPNIWTLVIWSWMMKVKLTAPNPK